MTDYPTSKIGSAYIRSSLILGVLLVLFTWSTADRLSGNYFPSDSPVLANYYPNDFLPWLLFLFLGLGWTIVDFVCKKHKGKKYMTLTVFLIIVVGFFLMSYLKLRLDKLFFQSDFQTLWASYFVELVNVCVFAWVMGGTFAYSINEILPYSLRGANSSND